jgi:hypothetical protein
MSEQSNATGVAQEVKKSWGFGTGSVSAEIQAAAAQIIADSRLPGANLSVLLNSFLNRYLPWPFRATPGIAVDTAGGESAEFGSLIYTSTQDLAKVPADVLACAIDVHQTLVSKAWTVFDPHRPYQTPRFCYILRCFLTTEQT